MADAWLASYESAKQTAAETLQLIQVPPLLAAAAAASTRPTLTCPHLPPIPPLPLQERNLKFPEGGPEASRLTATARRKLGTLGGLLDSLRASLEGPEQAGL